MEIIIRLHNWWFSHFSRNRFSHFNKSPLWIYLVFLVTKLLINWQYMIIQGIVWYTLAMIEVISLSQKPSSVILVFTLSTIKDRSSFVSEGMLSCPFVLVLPCLEFTCLVKPPFDLHTFSQLLQGKDFSPDISHRASAISSSIVSSSPVITDKVKRQR